VERLQDWLYTEQIRTTSKPARYPMETKGTTQEKGVSGGIKRAGGSGGI
jgi:hypothetical protein